MMPSPPPQRRCAIYTRKSTDEGLEQAFNSLDAQREACAAGECRPYSPQKLECAPAAGQIERLAIDRGRAF